QCHCIVETDLRTRARADDIENSIVPIAASARVVQRIPVVGLGGDDIDEIGDRRAEGIAREVLALPVQPKLISIRGIVVSRVTVSQGQAEPGTERLLKGGGYCRKYVEV